MKRFKTLVSIVAIMALCVPMLSGFAYTSKKAADDGYTLKFPSFWVGKDSKAATMTELIKKFNDANSGKIKVVVEEIADYNAYEDKMKTSIATNQVPDIFLFKSGSIGEIFFKSGKLMDFTSYMKEGWKTSKNSSTSPRNTTPRRHLRSGPLGTFWRASPSSPTWTPCRQKAKPSP